MALNKIVFKDKKQLEEHIKTHRPTFYYSSQTSTVIPYDKLEKMYQEKDFILGDLSQIPQSMELTDKKTLLVKGAVNWQEAKDFLQEKKRNIMTAPTEHLALITAGAATSATGERCFMFGNLRSQIHSIKYLDYQGKERSLTKTDPSLSYQSLKSYQQKLLSYESFKNAPFPRMEFATDLMIGTEGQLGVITEVELETTEDFPVNHLFMLLPKWEEDTQAHNETIQKIQTFRKDVVVCEFIDSNSFNYLPVEERPNQGLDALFFEVKTEAFERFYENFLCQLSFLNEEQVFELSASKFHHIRASIPRAVSEVNSRQGVVKMGTDIQLRIEQCDDLFNIYRDLSQRGVRYNLFGHFGDAHLHFNFMPTSEQTKSCQEDFIDMYAKVAKLQGSPFAEHGIGIIKQQFIKQFWTPEVYQLFKELKSKHDPHNQFFPQGYMSLYE